MPDNERRFIRRLLGIVALKIMAIALIAWALLPEPGQINPASVSAPTAHAAATRDRP